MLFGATEAAVLETEYLFQLLTPGNRVRREVELPDTHATALHGQRQHRLVVVDRFFDPLSLGNIADDLGGADNTSLGTPYGRNGKRDRDVRSVPTPANRFKVLDV